MSEGQANAQEMTAGATEGNSGASVGLVEGNLRFSGERGGMSIGGISMAYAQFVAEESLRLSRIEEWEALNEWVTEETGGSEDGLGGSVSDVMRRGAIEWTLWRHYRQSVAGMKG